MGFTEGYITKSKENLFWIRFKRVRRRFTQVKKGRWCCLSVECVICTFFHHYILCFPAALSCRRAIRALSVRVAASRAIPSKGQLMHISGSRSAGQSAHMVRRSDSRLSQSLFLSCCRTCRSTLGGSAASGLFICAPPFCDILRDVKSVLQLSFYLGTR